MEPVFLRQVRNWMKGFNMQEVLNQLKIKADVVEVQSNGTMSRYLLKMHPGAKVSKIERCSTEIALGVKAYSKPIIKVITEKGLVALELLTKPPHDISFHELLGELKSAQGSLPMILGQTHDGNNLVADLSKMPHLLIAGATGSGKSVMLHSIISSLIVNDADVRLALIDPKSVELSAYANVKQLLYPIATEPGNALMILSDLVNEMNNRFVLMAQASVNHISDYNERRKKKTPYIVLVIDEFSDLMYQAKKEFQGQLCVLAQKSRACGIHIIIATQRPSVDVVTGLIKANFPARISCRTTSLTDSRVILDSSGAEKLLGKGDSLIKSSLHDMVRFKGAFISLNEVNEICKKNKRGLWARILNYTRNV